MITKLKDLLTLIIQDVWILESLFLDMFYYFWHIN